MAITEANIKIFASERFTDDIDGGGFQSPIIVMDGVENNVFLDVSSLDRAAGRLNLRKVYPGVQNSGTDTYLGTHLIVDEAPADPAVSGFLLSLAPTTPGQLALDRTDLLTLVNVIGNIPRRSVYNTITGHVDDLGPDFNLPGDAQAWQIVGGAASHAVHDSGGGINYYNYFDSLPSAGLTTISLNYSSGGDSSGIDTAAFRGMLVSVNGNGLRVVASTSSGQNLTLTTALDFDAPYGPVLLLETNPLCTYRAHGIRPLLSDAAVNDTIVYLNGSIFDQIVPCDNNGALPAISPTILGIDPTAWTKFGGGVPIYSAGDVVVIHNTVARSAEVVTAGEDIDLGRTRLADVRVVGNDGLPITTGFVVNKLTGHIIFSTVSGYSQPVTIKHRVEDLRLIQSIRGDGKMVLNKGLTHVFPHATTFVSGAQIVGDIFAHAHIGFQQATWTSVFSDAVIGSGISADYNEPAYPIVVTNDGAIKERWALVFTNTTSFNIIGEQVGQIGSGNTSTTCAPTNPATGHPYFSINPAGWGLGWAIGNVYRFNTDSANFPAWIARSIRPSEPYVGQDKVTIAVRGDIDAS